MGDRMMQKLSDRDIRAIKLGAVGLGAILLIMAGGKIHGRWAQLKEQIRIKEAQLDLIDVDKAKAAGIASIVPVFEMPEKEQAQKVRFRKVFTEQLKKAGIRTEPLKVIPTKRLLLPNYRLMNFQCSAKCRFTQVLDLLARLNENPHLVGIEEFKIKCDKSKPQDVELDLTVSTAVRIR